MTTSSYSIIDPVPPSLPDVLADALGIRATIVKRREIQMYHNVRIHLDSVEGLGNFIELEGVISDNCDEMTTRRRVSFLLELLDLHPNQYIATSYGDMMLDNE